MMNYDTLLGEFKEKIVFSTVDVTIPEGYTTDEIIDLFVNQYGIGTREGFVDVIQNYDFDYWFIEDVYKRQTVYRVTKRRLTEMDIPVDDITPPEVQKAGEIEGFEEPAPLPAEPEEYDESEYNTAVDERNSAVVDEKIFDEVMRRTKERIEKGKRTDSLRDTDETEIKPKVIDVPAPAAKIPAEPVTAPASEKTVTPGSDESDFGDIADESIDAGDVLDAVAVSYTHLVQHRAYACDDKLPYR